MPYNKSPAAFEDCRQVFEQAMATPRGIRLTLASTGAATGLIGRLNTYRKMDRETNKSIYPPDDPMHGTSDFDRYIIRKQGTEVVIELRELNVPFTPL